MIATDNARTIGEERFQDTTEYFAANLRNLGVPSLTAYTRDFSRLATPTPEYRNLLLDGIAKRRTDTGTPYILSVEEMNREEG